jgi:hypothetical protein
MKTSLIIFNGSDYFLSSCIGLISLYCDMCKEKDIIVDIYCPRAKFLNFIIPSLCNINRVIFNIDENEPYNFTRIINLPKRTTCMTSNSFINSVKNDLGIQSDGYIHWSKISWFRSNFLDLIKRGFGLRVFSLININERYYSLNSHESNILASNLYSTGKPVISFGGTRFNSHCSYIDKISIQQAIINIALSELYIGNDSLFSQISANIGIPTFIISESSGYCRLKQSMENVRYEKRAAISPISIKEFIKKW